MRGGWQTTLLVASLTMVAAGCGGRSSAVGSPDTPTARTAPSRVVYFSSSAPTAVGAHELLHDQGELSRFAQRVAARSPRTSEEIVAAGKATDFSRSALVGWTAGTGCSAATSASLVVSGSRLSLRVVQPDPPQECVRAFGMTAVFEVPKEKVPPHPAFG
ncbi:hypothetical protein [Streptomyces sp. NBC_01190]|uniref:hypothetical protein n=1 Tax=Streptomyces sp. NBC_01190 TaxID=2903767 RepID=UPI003868E492|nr:hypothetical protein OG519_10715 [Streptomyces sp. NBC_01190]